MEARYRDDYWKIRDSMNGMLNIKFMYDVPMAKWKQFSQDVISAFDHPIFNGLARIRKPREVDIYLLLLLFIYISFIRFFCLFVCLFIYLSSVISSNH